MRRTNGNARSLAVVAIWCGAAAVAMAATEPVVDPIDPFSGRGLRWLIIAMVAAAFAAVARTADNADYTVAGIIKTFILAELATVVFFIAGVEYSPTTPLQVLALSIIMGFLGRWFFDRAQAILDGWSAFLERRRNGNGGHR